MRFSNDKRSLNAFLREDLDGLNTRLRSLDQRTLKFGFYKVSHFFERMGERDVDKGHVGSLFKDLIDGYVCRLLYSLEVGSYEYTMKTSTHVNVSYKTVRVPFMVKKTEGSYTLIPKTIMSETMPFTDKPGQVIEINMDTDQVILKRY